MSVEFLSGIAGVALSLGFSYIPNAESKWAKLDGNSKRLIMLVLLLLVAIVLFVLSCAGLSEQFKLAVTCTQAGAIDLLKVFGMAAIANQTAYALSPAKN